MADTEHSNKYGYHQNIFVSTAVLMHRRIHALLHDKKRARHKNSTRLFTH